MNSLISSLYDVEVIFSFMAWFMLLKKPEKELIEEHEIIKTQQRYKRLVYGPSLN